MKYSNGKVPMQCFMRQSTCYKNTSKMDVFGVLWHSTGANNPNLKRYVQPDDVCGFRDELLELIGVNQYKNDWNHTEHNAGLNAFIGKLADGSVSTLQTMPWDFAPWGCGVAYKGGPSCNSHWIQFEICEDDLKSKTYFDQVYKEACELTAYLCKMYNLNPKGTVSFEGKDVPVILCHQDSYQLGLGCNHGDVLHWFKIYGKTMDDVRNDVYNLIFDDSRQDDPIVEDGRYNSITQCPIYARPTIIKMVDKGLINGTGTGKKDSDGRPADLSLSLDMIRVFVVMDRAGLLGS